VQGYAVSIARMVDLPALAPALARLERTALESHFFFGPAALEAARTVLPEVRAARLLLVADAAGELAACLPLRPTVPGLLPRPVEPLDHPDCFLRVPLLRAADGERALAALLDGLGRLEFGGPALRMPDVPEGPLLEGLLRLRARWRRAAGASA
jgi:hypothetical protein